MRRPWGRAQRHHGASSRRTRSTRCRTRKPTASPRLLVGTPRLFAGRLGASGWAGSFRATVLTSVRRLQEYTRLFPGRRRGGPVGDARRRSRHAPCWEAQAMISCLSTRASRALGGAAAGVSKTNVPAPSLARAAIAPSCAPALGHATYFRADPPKSTLPPCARAGGTHALRGRTRGARATVPDDC